jgi:hypothetical protein
MTIIFVILAYFLPIIDGFVVSKVWNWHLVSLGLPAISFIQATIFVLFLNLISIKHSHDQALNGWVYFLAHIIGLAYLLIFAWLAL